MGLWPVTWKWKRFSQCHSWPLEICLLILTTLSTLTHWVSLNGDKAVHSFRCKFLTHKAMPLSPEELPLAHYPSWILDIWSAQNLPCEWRQTMRHGIFACNSLKCVNYFCVLYDMWDRTRKQHLHRRPRDILQMQLLHWCTMRTLDKLPVIPFFELQFPNNNCAAHSTTQ